MDLSLVLTQTYSSSHILFQLFSLQILGIGLHAGGVNFTLTKSGLYFGAIVTRKPESNVNRKHPVQLVELNKANADK